VKLVHQLKLKESSGMGLLNKCIKNTKQNVFVICINYVKCVIARMYFNHKSSLIINCRDKITVYVYEKQIYPDTIKKSN